METADMKILIIDDDTYFVDSVSSIISISEPKLKVLSAHTGYEGLNIIEAHKPDLLICDMILPDINGYEICKRIKEDELLRQIPIIVVTGVDSRDQLKMKFLEAGAEAFLMKPFDESVLLAHLRSLLRLKKAEDRNRLERDILKVKVRETYKYLKDNQERLELILDNIIEGIWDWDLINDRIFVSSKGRQLLGLDSDEHLDEQVDSFFDLMNPEDIDRFRKEVDEYINHINPAFKSEVRMRYKDGSYRWFLFRGLAVWDDEDKPKRILGTQSDITEDKETIKNLEKIALYDYITRLPNRILFYDLVEKEISASFRNDNKVGFIFIDLDNFKEVNDLHGHNIGDQLLMKIGKSLVANLRPLDILARFGGDEFVISLPGIEGKEAIDVVNERLRNALRTPFAIEDLEVFAEFSAGYSISPDDGDKVDDLIKIADQRMYEDKALRRTSRRSISVPR